MLKIKDIVRTPLKRNRFSVLGQHGDVQAIRDGNAIHPAGLPLFASWERKTAFGLTLPN